MEVVGVVKQLPTELLSGRQDSSLGMKRGGFEEHIPTPITQPPPLVISLWRRVWLYSLHGRTGIAQRHSKSGTSRIHKWSDVCCELLVLELISK